MNTNEQIRQELQRKLDSIQFLSPNEPITPWGVQRIIDQMEDATSDIEGFVGEGRKSITMWSPNLQYNKGDMVMVFKQESKQASPDADKREFVFILVSIKNENDSMPNYDLVDGIPDFTKSGWMLLNPMSYLLQDLIGMKAVVKEVFSKILEEHVENEHGLVGSSEIGQNLVRTDYSNLVTPMQVGKHSLVIERGDVDEIGMSGVFKKSSDGILEYQLKYSFDAEANQDVTIKGRRHYRQKSPIWDESDNTIFCKKYVEDDLFSVNVNPIVAGSDGGTAVAGYRRSYNNLRYGTNVFHKHIKFPIPFVNEEYMVFFDTYGNGEFVFGYGKSDLQEQTEPTYDAIVSMPMLMNKTESGFDIVLPIHCHFNSIQKFNVGVPWNNVFTLQAIGRYR